MRKVFFHLGSRVPDYRSLMRDQKDFVLGGRLIPIESLVIAEQTHSALVHKCQQDDSGAGIGSHPQIPIADGLVTNLTGQFLLVRTADCTPVILFDNEVRAVCAVHSGREGTRKNIVGQAVRTMVREYGCIPQAINAYIGAGICEDHYQVSEEIYHHFNESLIGMKLSPCKNNFRHLNIRTTIFQQLILAGIPFLNIENVFECTYENEDFFSYRRDQTNNRQINVIGIIDE